MTDPIVLAAEARAILQKLHQQGDVVVRFKTDATTYAEDKLDEIDREAPGHFQADKNILTLNLDELTKGKPMPKSLASLEDWRQYPVLAGVAAHESGHARFSNWDQWSVEDRGESFPESIPNPDYDPDDPSTHVRTIKVKDDGTGGTTPTSILTGATTAGPGGIYVEKEIPVPESFQVSGNGQLAHVGALIEEPRIERLGVNAFTKTWQKAMEYSAGHLILESIEEMEHSDLDPIDSALSLAILIGGRQAAGTLGKTHASREQVSKVMKNAQDIIEKALSDNPNAVSDPFHEIMGIVTSQVFSNDHNDPTGHLEAARRILAIAHPESADNPDSGNGPASGNEGDEDGEGSGSGGGEFGGGEMGQAMKEMMDALKESADGVVEQIQEAQKVEQENDDAPNDRGGHGSVLFDNPRAPQVREHVQPTQDDRDLYKRAREWMNRQIEPTVTTTEQGQWLPVGGARLDVRSYVRDNLAGHRANQRSDWNREADTVKPAPPVKVAIMLDGSGSMSAFARASAGIAWAAANAAADLPESRTVSVVYGDAAAVTQQPGHQPARTIAVSNTNGGTEDFYGASRLVESALWLDEPVEEGQNANTLIIIISDLVYGGTARYPGGRTEPQATAFNRIVRDWADRGYNIMVVGATAGQADGYLRSWSGGVTSVTKLIEDNVLSLVQPDQLFK